MVQRLWLIVALPTTHHLAFFVGLHMSQYFFNGKFFAALLPPEWLLLSDGIVATNNGHTCDVQRISGSIALLLARILSGFSGLLLISERAPDDLVACFVLHDRRAYLKCFKCELIYFYMNTNKPINQ